MNFPEKWKKGNYSSRVTTNQLFLFITQLRLTANRIKQTNQHEINCMNDMEIVIALAWPTIYTTLYIYYIQQAMALVITKSKTPIKTYLTGLP